MKKKYIYVSLGLLVLGLAFGLVAREISNLSNRVKASSNQKEIISQSYIEDKLEKNGQIEKNNELEENVGNYSYTIESINFRRWAGEDNNIMFKIPKGEKVELVEDSYSWAKVLYKDLEGYVFREYISDNKVERTPSDLDNIEDDRIKLIKDIVLVNKEYGVPRDYFTRVDPLAKEHLAVMLAVAKEEAGLLMKAHSSFRTNDLQKSFFSDVVNRKGLAYAKAYSAQACHSEHEIGQAFDICDNAEVYRLKIAFEDSKEGIWLRENAHRFGFILRYPKGKTEETGYAYEPWHFRYVGEEHAKIIYDKNITLEKYLFSDGY